METLREQILEPEVPLKDHCEAFKGLQIIRQIEDSSTPRYLVFCHKEAKYYIAKTFPFEFGKTSPLFNREASVLQLDHPNLVSRYEANPNYLWKISGKEFMTSYILTEVIPYGNFFDLYATCKKVPDDEKLARTFFQQLISGIEYLHKQGFAHLDLKMHSLYVADKFRLKIANLQHVVKFDEKVQITGAKNYRPLEMMEKRVEDPKKVDIYAAGIILFVLRLGVPPYRESSPESKKLMDYLKKGLEDKKGLNDKKNSEDFWKMQKNLMPEMFEVGDDFKDLFWGMVKVDPCKRFSLNDIKNSKWFQGPVYTEKEVADVLNRHFRYLTLKLR